MAAIPAKESPQPEPPVSDWAEEEIPLDPLLALLAHKHAMHSEHYTSTERADARAAIISAIRANDMLPYLQFHGALFADDFTQQEQDNMQVRIDAQLATFDAKIKDAEENLGDTEVRDALAAKCDFFARIGDMKRCVAQNELCASKTLGHGPRVDLTFQRIRLGLAFSDVAVVKKAIEDATKLIKDADWERRNRFRVYEGLYLVSVRNSEKGSKLLLESLATFAATELVSLRDYIFITVVASLIQLDRGELRKKIVDSPEVISANIPEIDGLLTAFYKCKYADVFPGLEKVCNSMLRNVFLTSHVNYFFREARIKAFNQFLDSYSSVTLSSMSQAFDLPVSVLDQMLYTLISNERLACKIDRANGRVHTMRGEGSANYQFHQIIKEGDALLSRLQKLSRVVEL